jgi:hypothetical protein
MNRSRQLLHALLIGCCAFAGVCWTTPAAQFGKPKPKIDIKGKVVDEKGLKGVAGVSVTVWTPTKATDLGASRADGTYTFQLEQCETFHLTFIKAAASMTVGPLSGYEHQRIGLVMFPAVPSADALTVIEEMQSIKRLILLATKNQDAPPAAIKEYLGSNLSKDRIDALVAASKTWGADLIQAIKSEGNSTTELLAGYKQNPDSIPTKNE